MTKCQYGGKKGLSTVKAVDSIVSYVIDCFENKKSVAATLLDQCKTYDIVPYPLLMYKFLWYKVRGLQLSLKIDLRPWNSAPLGSQNAI